MYLFPLVTPLSPGSPTTSLSLNNSMKLYDHKERCWWTTGWPALWLNVFCGQTLQSLWSLENVGRWCIVRFPFSNNLGLLLWADCSPTSPSSQTHWLSDRQTAPLEDRQVGRQADRWLNKQIIRLDGKVKTAIYNIQYTIYNITKTQSVSQWVCSTLV